MSFIVSWVGKCWCVIIDWTLPRRGPRKTKARGQLNLQSRVLKITQHHSLTFISLARQSLNDRQHGPDAYNQASPSFLSGKIFCVFYSLVQNQFRSNCRWKSIIKILFSNMSSAIYLLLVWTSFYASGVWTRLGWLLVCLFDDLNVLSFK